MSKVLEKTVIEIEGTLMQLRSQYSEWSKQQKITNKMLYALLDGCYDFYCLLKKDDDCVHAFRELVGFKIRNNTKLSAIILKEVFGDEVKTVYAYSKVIEEAYKIGVGSENSKTLSIWLNENGGIDNIIRKPKQQSRAEQERQHAILVGRNPKDYGIDVKENSFTSTHLKDGYKQFDEFVLLCKKDANSDKILIQWVEIEEKHIDNYYAQLGRLHMQSKLYKDNRLEANKKQQQRKNIAKIKVQESLSKIVKKAYNKIETKKAA